MANGFPFNLSGRSCVWNQRSWVLSPLLSMKTIVCGAIWNYYNTHHIYVCMQLCMHAQLYACEIMYILHWKKTRVLQSQVSPLFMGALFVPDSPESCDGAGWRWLGHAGALSG